MLIKSNDLVYRVMVQWYVYPYVLKYLEEHVEISRDFKEKVVEPILKVMMVFLASRSVNKK